MPANAPKLILPATATAHRLPASAVGDATASCANATRGRGTVGMTMRRIRSGSWRVHTSERYAVTAASRMPPASMAIPECTCSTDPDMPACVSSGGNRKPEPNRNVTEPKAMMMAICLTFGGEAERRIGGSGSRPAAQGVQADVVPYGIA